MCSNGGSEGGVLALVGQALEALRAAGRLPLGGAVSDVELTQLMQRLEAAVRVAKGHQSAVVREISAREAHRGLAAGSTADLLVRTLRLTPGEARTRAELAEGLAVLPDTHRALADGRIGVGQAKVAVKKANEVAGRDDAAELVALVDQVAASTGQLVDRNRLAREIDTELARTNDDVLAERERRAFARRSVRWTVRDGMHVLHAELDPVGGWMVRAVLDSLSGKTGDGDTRTFEQRQADALAQMAAHARQADGAPKGTLQSARVLLMVASRCAGRRRNHPEALQGTRPRLGLGHPEFALGGPGRRPRPRQASARARTAGADMSGVCRGNRPRVLAMRPWATRDRCGAHRRPARSGWAAPEAGIPRRHATRRSCHTHIHQHGWQVTRDTTGRYRASPPDLVPPHLDNSIEQRALTHTR